MNSEEINRFNVYTQIFPNNRQNFYLESWDGSVWEPVTYQRNRLNFHSLDSIAKRIVQLSPDNNLYKRIIFANSPLDNRDGRLEGIELHNGEPRLVDSLTRKEKVDLLVKIQKYFSELKKEREYKHIFKSIATIKFKMKTYKPFLIESTNLPLIVYAFEDSNTNRTRNSLIEDLNFILPKSMIPESSQFAIIFPWNKFDGVQLADIHIYHDFNNAWIKANPSIRDYCWQGNTNYDWRNGSLLNEGGNSCETATIIRGIEGIYRRTTSSLDDYLSARPKLYHFLTNNQEF